MNETSKATGVKKHSGGCHCGAVRYEAEIDLGKPASHCNCSLCTKRQALASIIRPGAFRLVSGDAALGIYEWGGRTSKFHFCTKCGIHVFGKGHLAELGGDYVAVNVVTIDDVDAADLAVIHWDGRHDNWDAGPRDRPWPVHAA